ncbi:MAG: tRNA epoxyqueuosine(34) reductase QueG [Crocinitomicaceae bacterium]|nr:tRNA epoxyqueuosine(34) reductase QueG [Crocinitomicaceae bacterium]
MLKSEISQKIKSKAIELGFLSCGISKSEFLEEEAPRLEAWLRDLFNGKMSYMENHFDKRLNPSLLVDKAKSVISVLYNYYPSKDLFKDSSFKISKYAYGEDYHFVIQDKLNVLLDYIREIAGNIHGKCFTDSAPVLDKAWAKKSGLGWIGKNGNLLTQKVGSFYFIGEIILDLDLEYDHPADDHCGTCTACIDACPTQAIIKPYVVDGSRCISYLTIELKDEFLSKEFQTNMDGWIFGCDVCQDVCPWNRFSSAHNEHRFNPDVLLSQTEFDKIQIDQFEKLFGKSAIKRTGFKGLKRNIQFLDLTKK